VTTISSRRAALLALGALRCSAASIAAASPLPRQRLRWRELADKLEAYETFRRGELQARARAGEVPLATLVEDALAQGSFHTLWTIEGHGYGHAEHRAERGTAPRDWLAADVAGLPPGSLVAFHCGVGLSLVRRRLAAQASTPAAALRRALADHLAACRELAPPAPVRPLLEALGFLARLRLPRRTTELAAELMRLGDGEAHACFWHGVGRALYFTAGHLAPWAGAPWRAVATLEREAPPGVARDNAVAGLAWAVTLVNLRHPRVLAELLRHHAGQLAAATPGFARGVSSAVRVWRHCVPNDPALAAWRGYQPPPAAGELARLWSSHVRGPAEAALARDDLRPGRSAAAGLGEPLQHAAADGAAGHAGDAAGCGRAGGTEPSRPSAAAGGGG
jgi:hypothetical protein